MILLSLFITLSAFSLIAFGGVNALLPTLFAIAVEQQQWIDAETFAHYFAIAQAAPGPNLMTVTLIGWHVSGVMGALIATLAICWPSSILIFWLQHLISTMRHERGKQTIQFAAAALAVGLILASAWQIALQINSSWVAYALTLSAALIATATRWHPLYLILIGAVLGLLGLI